MDTFDEDHSKDATHQLGVLIQWRDAGAVDRYHAARIPGQTVADHSWGVAMVLLAIGADSPALLRAALTHDIPELLVGDMPAPTKRDAPPEFRKMFSALEREAAMRLGVHLHIEGIAPWEEPLLKFADIMELCLYAHESVRAGNTYAAVVRDRGIKYLHAMVADGAFAKIPGHYPSEATYPKARALFHAFLEHVKETR